MCNSKSRRRISRLATPIGLTYGNPAGFTFVDVLQKSRFQVAAQLFLDIELQRVKRRLPAPDSTHRF